MKKSTIVSIITIIIFTGNGIIGSYFGRQEGISCGIIATKMDILTDNGTGEYKRLSDSYFYKGCPLIDVGKIRAM